MSVLPTSSIGGGATQSSAKSGFASLTTADFMRMLIAELQQQDPTQPMNSQDLLTQLATMTQMQSTNDLDNALTSNTTTQQLSLAASLIGKTINGTDVSNNPVTGVVGQAFMQNGSAFVGVGSSQVPLANVTAVAQTATS